MTKHSIAASCALTLAAFGFASTTFAGPDVKETKDIKETVKESCISGNSSTRGRISSKIAVRSAFLAQPGKARLRRLRARRTRLLITI